MGCEAKAIPHVFPPIVIRSPPRTRDTGATWSSPCVRGRPTTASRFERLFGLVSLDDVLFPDAVIQEGHRDESGSFLFFSFVLFFRIHSTKLVTSLSRVLLVRIEVKELLRHSRMASGQRAVRPCRVPPPKAHWRIGSPPCLWPAQPISRRGICVHFSLFVFDRTLSTFQPFLQSADIRLLLCVCVCVQCEDVKSRSRWQGELNQSRRTCYSPTGQTLGLRDDNFSIRAPLRQVIRDSNAALTY